MKTVKGAAFGIFVVWLLLPFLLRAGNPENSIVLKGATVYTAVGPPIKNATIVVENGKITAVGENVNIPSGIKVLDVSGKVIIPGLIDAHTHIGTYVANDVNEFPQPIGPENRALDAIHIDVPDWMDAVKGGVTTVITGPGSGERMGGQSITLKTFGEDLEKRILKESGELKMAVNGINLSHIPTIHSNFLKAREYMKTWEKYETGEKKGPSPKKDLAMDALAGALSGESIVRVHIMWAHDIMTFLRLKDEFGFNLQFIHAPEAWKVADEIAKRKVGVICMPIELAINVPEDLLYGFLTLYKAGVKIAMHSDHPVSPQKFFRLSASMGIRYGLPEEEALKAVTINPAEMAGLQDRIGSIEKGKDADIVILNGTWYELKTRVDMVFIDGILAYDRAQEEKTTQEGT